MLRAILGIVRLIQVSSYKPLTGVVKQAQSNNMTFTVRTRTILLGSMLLIGALLIAGCSNEPATTTIAWETSTTSGNDTATTSTITLPEDPGVDVTAITTPPGDVVSGLEMQELTLYIDGWSVLALDGDQLQAQAEGLAPVPVELTALTTEEMATFITAYPQEAETVAARLINTDRGWVCQDGECSNSSGNVPNIVTLLSEPDTIDGYGESYRSWGMESGVYKGVFNLPVESIGYDLLTASGFTSRIGGESEGTFAGEDGVLIAAGFGVLFEPSAYWGETDVVGAYNYYKVGTVGSPSRSQVELVDAIVLAGGRSGLSDTGMNQNVSGLHPSELTFMTSPTTGCGTWTVCVPGKNRGVLDELLSEEVTNLCAVPEITISGEVEQLTARYTDELRTVTIPVATHLNGVWGGLTPETFPRSGSEIAGDRLYGVPPLANGVVQLRVSSLRIYTNGALGVVSLWSSSGRTLEIGADDQTKIDGEYTLDDVLTNYGGGLTRCN